jgi:hypothetical protein
VRRVVGMGRVFQSLLGGDLRVTNWLFGADRRLGGRRCLHRGDDRRFGQRFNQFRSVRFLGVFTRYRSVAFIAMGVLMLMICVRMVIVVRFGVVVMMPGLVRLRKIFFARLVSLIGLRGLQRIGAGVLHDLSLDALAMAAAAGIAMARAAAMAGTVFALFFGLAMGALIRLDQRLTVGDRDLIVVGMDFAEGQEAVAVAAILDEGRLQRRFYARDFGEVDIAAQLLALGGLEIKLFDAIATDHNDPGLFRVGGIDQHFVWHFATLDGGGRVWRCAHHARPGDATVHLIRG